MEKPKVENKNEEREKELKQINSQIAKSEKEISRLEAEIKIFDDKLSDSAQYQIVVNDKEAFAKYEALKKTLDAEMQNWEALQAKLEN